MSAGSATPEPAPTEQQWRRVHPVTPLVRAWAALVALLFILGSQMTESIQYADEVAGQVSRFWWVALLALLLFLLVVGGVTYLAWRMTSYAVDDDAAHLRKGILFRQQRHARLDRLQAVDVRQPLLARLFGLAELALEVAGGSDSTVTIGFLRLDDANQLRAELLARAAGVKARRAGGAAPSAPADGPTPAPGTTPAYGTTAAPGTTAEATPVDASPGERTPATVGSDGSTEVAAATGSGAAASTTTATDDAPDLPAQEAPENLVYEVPPGRLVASLLRLPAIWIILLAFVGLGVAVGVTRNFGLLGSVLPGLLGGGAYLFSRFAGEFGFRAAVSPDGIRLRHGLLETRAQTIPPGRVQALSITQGFWWRGKGWWRVKVNVAGYGTEGQNQTQHVLLPVGPRDEAMVALWLVLPDLGAEDVAAVVDEGLTGDARTDRHFTTSPRSARVLDPISWRRNGFAVADRALFLRTGRLTRVLTIVPHERTQSLQVAQGPWQRRRGVATFSVHSTPGPVTPVVPHLASDDAAHLLDRQSVRARAARSHQPPERWMEQVTALAPVQEPVAGPAATDGGPAATTDGGTTDGPATTGGVEADR